MDVPLSEVKLLRQMMLDLAAMNDRDMKEYLMKENKYHLYLQAKAHKSTCELWAMRVEELIERYKDEE